MEFESSIDHFYTIGNVAVFPLGFADGFPNIGRKVVELGYTTSDHYMTIFAAVDTDQMITASTFDAMNVVGFAVVDPRISTIGKFFFPKVNDDVKTKILDVINLSLHGQVFAFVYTNNPNYDVDVKFLVKYGFTEPELFNKTVRLKYSERLPVDVVLMQINAKLSILKTNVGVLKLFVPKIVASAMSYCLNDIYEASGILRIIKYVNDVAILGISSDDIVKGSEGSVELPETYSPFVFHTHPDHITRESKAYVGWPSGQDMMSICMSYFQNRNQLVHFVPSPEGVWIVHVATDFQRILINLRLNNSIQCAQDVFRAVYDVFTSFETPRLTSNVTPMDRRAVVKAYMQTVKHYNLNRLIHDVPSLLFSCSKEWVEDSDPQLFNVSLIKWKYFSSSSAQGVFLTFDYFVDDLTRDNLKIPR